MVDSSVCEELRADVEEECSPALFWSPLPSLLFFGRFWREKESPLPLPFVVEEPRLALGSPPFSRDGCFVLERSRSDVDGSLLVFDLRFLSFAEW